MDNKDYEKTYQTNYKLLPMIISIHEAVIGGLYALYDIIGATSGGYAYGEKEIGLFYPLIEESTLSAFIAWAITITITALITKQIVAIVISPKIVAVERLTEIRDSMKSMPPNEELSELKEGISETNEKYSTLFTLPVNLYAEGAPIIIAAGVLLKDNQTGKVLAQIKLKNISPKTITAVKVSLNAFDISGTKLKGIEEYQYLDLSAARNMEFGQKNEIPISNDLTRSFSCRCKSVIFSDGTQWEDSASEWTPIANQETLTKRLGSLAEQYRLDTIQQAQFVVTDDRDLWLCTCGAINKQRETKCHSCHSEKSALIAALDMKVLTRNKEKYDDI